MPENESAERNFELFIPFIIDGEGYSDRDRQMFVAGYEFCLVRILLEEGEPIERPIHTENADRLRVLCGRFNRTCSIEQIDETWSNLEVGAI